MNNSIKLTAAVLVSLSSGIFAAPKTVILDVSDMTCSACPVTVRKALEQVSGVTLAKTSLETKSATVTFDDAKTDVAHLEAATFAAGYPSQLRLAKK